MQLEKLSLTKELLNSPNVDQLLIEHHLEGLFYERLPSQLTKQECKKQWLRQWQLSESLTKEVEAMAKVLDEYAVTIIILKGLSLQGSIYNPGERFMCDADLLILPNERNIIETYLKEVGFNPVTSEKFSANNYKYEWTKVVDGTDITIELHTKLFAHIPFELDWLTLRDSHISHVKRLCLEDEILFLSYHLAFQHNFLKLYWLYDLFFIVSKHKKEINWDYLRRKAKAFQIKNSLNSCLNVLGRFFGMHDLIKYDFRSSFINTDFLIKQNRSGFRYFLLKHLLKDSIFYAIRYDFEYFFSSLRAKYKKAK